MKEWYWIDGLDIFRTFFWQYWLDQAGLLTKIIFFIPTAVFSNFNPVKRAFLGGSDPLILCHISNHVHSFILSE